MVNKKIRGEFYINGAYRNLQSTSALSANTKYNAALTYDGTTVKLYVNGVLDKSMSVSGTISLPYSNTVMAIGANPGGANASSGYLNGKIYNAVVYNRALTADEVKQNSDWGLN